jgi:acyl-CoA thioester hydrolase
LRWVFYDGFLGGGDGGFAVEAMSEKIYKLSIRVDRSMIDGNEHVNNVVYVQWMQQVAMGHSATWGVDGLMEEQGVTWFARKHVIEYLQPVFLGDEIEARTWIADVGRVKSLRRYEFVRGTQVVARGETDWVYVSIATGRPARIPEVMKSFVLNVS